MAKGIYRSVRIGNDPVIAAFAARQSNFSKSVQILIKLYAQQEGIDNIKDLWAEYEQRVMDSFDINLIPKKDV